MARIFISYARVDRAFANHLSHLLRAHRIWMDDRIFAGTRWWDEILQQLGWCEVFIFLVSPASLASKYCRKEFRIARDMGVPIISILIEPGITVPPEVAAFEYLDFSDQLGADQLADLYNAFAHFDQKRAARQPGPAQRPARAAVSDDDAQASPVPHNNADALQEGLSALANEDFDRAVMLFTQLNERGYASRYYNVVNLLEIAARGLEEKLRNKERDEHYASIGKMMARERLWNVAADAFWKFQADYPDHDPGHYGQMLREAGFSPPLAAPAVIVRFSLPHLHWIAVQAGTVRVLRPASAEGEAFCDVPVGLFEISKYEVTNQQFQAFLDDPKGYTDPRWWDFWLLARNWKRKNPHPEASRFPGPLHPRTDVTWFEAMAFARWLAEKTGEPIALPMLGQLQRAARGDDDRLYPWGDNFDLPLANTSESRLQSTTPVTHYAEVASPFGAVDLTGNVWEWTRGLYDHEPDFDETIFADHVIARSVVGGSYQSNNKAARIDADMQLKPEVRFSTIGFRLVRLSG